MIDKETAISIVMEHILINLNVPGDKIVIMDEKTIEKNWGWIFFYQGKRWIETKDRRYKILGLYPIVIEKNDGSLHFLDVRGSLEECVREYEKRREISS